MPDTTIATSAAATVSTGVEWLDQLMQQEWFPYAALTALALFVLWLIIHPRKKQKPKCACCESGGSVIGGVRMSSTDLWVKEAKYCPFCGRKLKP